MRRHRPAPTLELSFGTQARTVKTDISCVKRLRIAYTDRVCAIASAEARCRTLRCSCRARNKALVPLVLLPVLVLVIAGALLWPAHSTSIASGGIAAAILLYVVVRLLLVPRTSSTGAKAPKPRSRQPSNSDRSYVPAMDRRPRSGLPLRQPRPHPPRPTPACTCSTPRHRPSPSQLRAAS